MGRYERILGTTFSLVWLSRFHSFENSTVPAYRHQNRKTENPKTLWNRQKSRFPIRYSIIKSPVLVVKIDFQKRQKRLSVSAPSGVEEIGYGREIEMAVLVRREPQ
ncbi:hypothetical protein L873DRAFT_1810513 [Choiromyces venosus 120613-1]|uniref:Uncharacterized protein n=1 Tax=Choiromyces venosus 120613-1 TaxID=1336337 RepID=A0A3N4JIA9_9PEZI|nr:hypothetical protein L873DRAFT_1810513 [Choiromyces venosus 120613-1]